MTGQAGTLTVEARASRHVVGRVVRGSGLQDALRKLVGEYDLRTAWVSAIGAFEWVELPVLGEDGHPRHRDGESTDLEGLYFLGLHFQYAVSSTMVAGVGRDARRIARRIEAVRR